MSELRSAKKRSEMRFTSGGREHTRGPPLKKDQNHNRGEMHNLQRICYKLQRLQEPNPEPSRQLVGVPPLEVGAMTPPKTGRPCRAGRRGLDSVHDLYEARERSRRMGA
jgi:hypothetical protein